MINKISNIFKQFLKPAIFFGVLALMAVSCQDDIPVPDYTRSGEDVRMKVSLSLPQMDVRTRATIDEIGLNQVNTLWIRTYSAETGEATSKWYKFTPGTTGVEQLNEFELDTKSGSSYIVGVANVDNDAVSKDDPTDIHPIKYFLDKADTWTDFLKIAVCTPSTYDKVYAPDVPLPMAGCFTNLVIGGDHTIYPHRLDDWQNENFRPIFIPASNTGNITMDGGGYTFTETCFSNNFQPSPRCRHRD